LSGARVASVDHRGVEGDADEEIVGIHGTQGGAFLGGGGGSTAGLEGETRGESESEQPGEGNREHQVGVGGGWERRENPVSVTHGAGERGEGVSCSGRAKD